MKPLTPLLQKECYEPYPPSEGFYQRNRDYYDRNAPTYEQSSWYLLNQYKRNKVDREVAFSLKLLKDRKPLRVLELGPGPGYLLERVLTWRQDLIYTAFEHSPVMRMKLQSRFFSRLQAGRLIEESLTEKLLKKTIKPGSLDLIMGNSILHHLIDYPEVVAGLASVLNQGGVMFFTREPLHRNDCKPGNWLQDGFEKFYVAIDGFFQRPVIRRLLWPYKIKAEGAQDIAYHMFRDGVSLCPFREMERHSCRVLWLRKYNRRMTTFFSYLDNEWLQGFRKDCFGNTLFSIGLQKTSLARAGIMEQENRIR